MKRMEATMRRAILAILLATAAACSGEGGSDDAGDGGDCEGGACENTEELCTDGIDNGDDGVQSYVDCRDEDCRPFAEACADVVTKPDGSPANFTGCEPLPDPLGADVSVQFYAEDFEDESRVSEGFTVDVYFDNAYHGDEADLTLVAPSGEELTAAGMVPGRTPIAYRFRAIPGSFKETIEYDVLTPADVGEMRAVTVAESTYVVIPATLGIRIESGKGIVAGSFNDCDGDTLANVIASVVPASEGIEMRYFVEEFPNREPVTTTEDGLWGAINVPPGLVNIQFHGRTTEGGELELLGEHPAEVVADSINIIDVEPIPQ